MLNPNYSIQERSKAAIKTTNGTNKVIAPTKKITIKHPSGNAGSQEINISKKTLSWALDECGMPKEKVKEILEDRQLKAKVIIEDHKGNDLNETFGEFMINVFKDNVQVETKEVSFSSRHWAQKKKIKVKITTDTGRIDELDMRTQMKEFLQEVLIDEKND